jgi:hypothetical protein
VPPNSLVFLRVYLFRGGLCVGGNWPGIDSRIVGWGRERQRSQAFALLQNPVDEINIANVGRFDHFQNSAGITVLWDLNRVILVGGSAHYNFESFNSDFSYLDRSEEQFFFSGSYAATKIASVGVRGTAALINYRTNFKNNGVLYSLGTCSTSSRSLSRYFFMRVRLLTKQLQFRKDGADFFCSIRWHRFLRDCDGAF